MNKKWILGLGMAAMMMGMSTAADAETLKYTEKGYTGQYQETRERACAGAKEDAIESAYYADGPGRMDDCSCKVMPGTGGLWHCTVDYHITYQR